MPTATRELAPLPPPQVPMFLSSGQMTREWYTWYQSIDEMNRALRLEVSETIDDIGNLFDPQTALVLTDGVAAPAAVSGQAQIYVDTADGDLKVRFGDNVTKTIVVDT